MAAIFGGAPGAFPGGEDLLTRLLQSGALAGLLNPEMDPMAQAAAAREAAGATLQARMGRRTPAAPVPTPFDAAPGALPDAATGGMPFAGLLNATGGFGPSPGLSSVPDLPPSTNDPGASEPTVYKDGVPLPRPRPAMAGLPSVAAPAAAPADDPASAYAADTAPAPAPFSMAPAARAPITSPGNPEDTALPRQLGGKSPGFLGKILDPALAPTLLALGSGFSGAGSIGTGMRRAFGNAVAPTELLQRQQLLQANQAQTYRALIAHGVSKEDALAAALDPDIKKATIARVFDTAPKLQKVGTDPLTGQDSFVWQQPNSMKLTPATVSGSGDAGASVSGSGGADIVARIQAKRDAGEDRQSLLKEVPAAFRDYTNAMIEGKAVPANLGRPGPARAAAITYAHAIDPTFDETKITERQTFAKGMGSTTPNSYGGQLQASGTVAKHLGDAYDALGVMEKGALGTSDTLPSLNPLKSAIRGEINDKAFLNAKGHWDIARKGIAGELEKLLSGSHGAEASKQYWMNKLDYNNGPTAIKAALDEVRSLMMGRVSNVAQARDRAYGGETDPLTLFGSKEKAIMDRIQKGTYQEPIAPATPAAPGAPTGVTSTGIKWSIQ